MTQKIIYFQNANPSPEEPFKFKDEVAFLSQAHNKIKKLTRVTNSKVADEIKTISGLEFADFLFVETKYPITGDSGESIDVIGFSLQNETESLRKNPEKKLQRKNFWAAPLLLRLEYYAEYYRQVDNVLLMIEEIRLWTGPRFNELKDKISEKGAITGKIIRLENIDNEKIDFEWQEASKSYRTLNIDTKNADFTIQVEEQAKEEPPIIEDWSKQRAAIGLSLLVLSLIIMVIVAICKRGESKKNVRRK